MQTKRLLRSRDQRVVAGVAGGIATYFEIDPVIVRLVFVVLGLANGVGVLLYLLLWLIVPNSDSVYVDARSQVRENVDEMRSTAETLVDRVRSTFSS